MATRTNPRQAGAYDDDIEVFHVADGNRGDRWCQPEEELIRRLHRLRRFLFLNGVGLSIPSKNLRNLCNLRINSFSQALSIELVQRCKLLRGGSILALRRIPLI